MLLDDKPYAETLAREFNLVVAENAMKFGPLRPTRETYNFAPADRLVEFAQAHNMKVRGHTLVWHNQLPRWLTSGDFSSEEASAILRDHIRSMMTHFKGKSSPGMSSRGIDTNPPYELHKTFWLEKLGPDYIENAFRWAHEADPARVAIEQSWK